MREDAPEDAPAPAAHSGATDIPKPLGVLDDKDIDYTQVISSPVAVAVVVDGISLAVSLLVPRLLL